MGVENTIGLKYWVSDSKILPKIFCLKNKGNQRSELLFQSISGFTLNINLKIYYWVFLKSQSLGIEAKIT